jgi:hypothetical protein
MSRKSIIAEVIKCQDKTAHPTYHPKECGCIHCWEDEMGYRVMLGYRLHTLKVWQRGKTV